MSRRRFLQLAGAAGIGLATPGLASCTPGDEPSTLDDAAEDEMPISNDVVTTHLPIDMPSRERREAAASSRMVLAHFFPVFPAIVDHRPPNDYWEDVWLPPGGTEGEIDHRAYGGLVRDRKWVGAGPTSGSVDTESKRENLRRELSLGLDAGLDGFTVELLSDGDAASPQTRAVDDLYEAALQLNDPYFRLVPMPDGTTPSTTTPEACATYVTELLGRPVPKWLIEGMPVIVPFAPEAAPQGAGSGGQPAVNFWTDVLDRVASAGAPRPLLWPCYVATWDASPQAGSFDEVAEGHGRWGEPYVAGYDHESGTVDAVTTCREAYRKPWMGFVMRQVDKPKAGSTWDSHGTRALATQWEAWIAAGDDCPVVHLPTWDDFSEGTQIAPSTTSGAAWADLTAVFSMWYKLGQLPEIVRDGLYLSSRRMIVGHDDNRFPATQSQVPSLYGTSPQSNMVEVRVFATAPATLRVFRDEELTGEFTVKAGMSSHDVPAQLGHPSAELVRDGDVVARVVGPVTIGTDHQADDRLYHLASSLRQQGRA